MGVAHGVHGVACGVHGVACGVHGVVCGVISLLGTLTSRNRMAATKALSYVHRNNNNNNKRAPQTTNIQTGPIIYTIHSIKDGALRFWKAERVGGRFGLKKRHATGRLHLIP